MDLSVIIISYNVRYFLQLCLCSVRKAAEHIDCEIFVVDNNSDDDTCSMVSREFPEVKLITNHINRGYSAANNQAIRLAAGRHILLLNPDTFIEEDSFTRCIKFMDGHPEAGAAGVRMINGKGKFLPESKRALPTPLIAFFKMSGLSFLFPKSEYFGKYNLGNLDNFKTTQADIISGAFMFLRREALLKTGLFDESFFMYGEDIDYSYRLLKEGFKNYYYPEIRIVHFKGESTKKSTLSVSVNFHKAMIIFVRKHFRNDRLRALIHPVEVAIWFRAGLSLLKQFAIFLLRFFSAGSIAKSGKTAIIANHEQFKRLTSLLTSTPGRCKISGRISINRQDINDEVLGNIDKLTEVVKINRIRKVIFATDYLRASQIIDSMHLIADQSVSVRIASEGEKFIVGSGFTIFRGN